MVISESKKEMCCGCTACMSVCPMHAISMREDREGFLYPEISDELCIHCGLCAKTCCIIDSTKRENVPLQVLGLKLGNDELRMKSSSGGAFYAIAMAVIRNGGCVFGARFDDDLNVVHDVAFSASECELFRGSKYVQSDINDCYVRCAEFLRKGIQVMFSGTPCQCDGLKHYLQAAGVSCENLILCDIICHGVPSPMIWKKYLELFPPKKILQYNFRDKNVNWHGDNIAVVYGDGKKQVNTPKLKIFSTLYFSSVITRPVCEHCTYTNLNRCSDITIGDFWGIEKACPEFSDNKGVSLVLVNTEKGQQTIDSISSDVLLLQSNTEACLQEQLKMPVRFNPKRAAFWEDFYSNGFAYVAKKYGHYDLYHKIRRRAANLIKIVIKKIRTLF